MSDPFVKLPHAVIDHADLDLHEFAVYIVLLRFRDPKTGKCWPGMSTIADAARMGVKSARKAITRLEERGLIQVDRVKNVGSKTNDPNTYFVGVLDEDPMKYLGKSAKGTRKPQRPLSDDSRERLSAAAKKRGTASEAVGGSASEALPSAVIAPSSASEAGGTASEAGGVLPPRHSKKNHLKKNHEEDLTSTFDESGPSPVSFPTQEDEPATEKQVAYLKDLATHLSYQAGNGVPNDLHIARWRKLTKPEADKLISQYLKELGNPFDREYPEPGTPHHEALTTTGKRFADSGGMPDSIWTAKEHIA